MELIEELDVMVPMRDGVRLRTDVFRPAEGGPFPVLVQRYPYSPRDGFMNMFGRQAAQNGYAVVVQSCRGRYGSEGDFYPFHPDVTDSYDTVEWAAAQPWSNGKVGMYGVSYSGMTQWTAAMARPPHLVCIAPALCTWDWTVSGWYQGDGVLTMGLDILWCAQMTAYEAERRGVEPPLPVFADVARMMDEGALGNLAQLTEFLSMQLDAASEMFAHRPLREIAELVEFAPWFRDMCDHGDPGDAYWRAIGAADRVNDIDLPVLHVAGWYDYFTRGALEAYASMRRAAPSAEARGAQRLLVGPWNHNGGPGRLDVGLSGGFFFDFTDGSPMMRFFAEHLKGVANDSAPVRIFVLGADEWRDEQEWPLARTVFTPFHLQASGGLAPDAPCVGAPDSYVHDPLAPVPGPAAVGATFNDRPDMRAVAERPDVLVYTTDPLQVATEITGPVRAEVWAATSAVSTDIVATLLEVFADGTPVVLCQGVMRAAALTPGAVYRHEVDMAATSVVVPAGHRLRLHIASSEYPTYEPNPGTGGRITHSTETVVATQHVFHDPAHPSRIVLPLIPPTQVTS